VLSVIKASESRELKRADFAGSPCLADQLEPDLHTHHCMVKAHIKNDRLNVALAELNELEESTPASMATYTMVLTALLSAPRAAQPTFWSLFHRMRLSAHPVPDAPLYAVAIHACAQGIPNPGEPGAAEADAERALDLFREMTTHHGIRPTAQTYNALMLACAKRRDMLPEAFRLLREMVELERTRLRALSHDAEAHDAASLTCFAPDRQTYNALLLGCARAGDLPQARWILAEMLRSASALWEENMHRPGARLSAEEALEVEGRRPDAASLTHLFHAYASYKPPLKLASLRQAAQQPAAAKSTAGEPAVTADEERDSLELAGAEEETAAITTPSADEAAQSFTPRVPQTSAEVLSEVRGLMGRILADLEGGSGLLANVRPSAQLLHAYLSALCEHLPRPACLATVRNALFGNGDDDKSLFARLGVEPNGHTYELVLAQCAAAPEGTAPDRLAAQAWSDWRALEDAHPRAKLMPRTAKKLGLEERTVSRIWAAMIRCHAK
jgi:pentatricopeptide repeat protein